MLAEIEPQISQNPPQTSPVKREIRRSRAARLLGISAEYRNHAWGSRQLAREMGRYARCPVVPGVRDQNGKDGQWTGSVVESVDR